MKKKILLVLLLPIILLGLTGCGSKEKIDTRKTITLSDPVFGYTTTFKYDKKEQYSEVEEDKSGASVEIEFDNENKDVEIEMYYTKMGKASYESTQKIRANQKYYKEYKFGKYKAYAYGEYSSGLYLNILLDVDSTDTAKILFVSIDRIDTDESKVVADILDKDLIKLFNTIEVKSID